MQPDLDTQKWMCQNMVKSRYFEECTERAYLEGKQPVFNMANGPIPLFREHLLKSSDLDEAALKKIEESMQSEVDEAFNFAR